MPAVPDPHRRYESRCPVHGFIPFSDWERDIINHAAFQRLRRIRQLAWTDQVYPGAMHTRFEHSLGVMHVASLLFDRVRKGSRKALEKMDNYTDDELNRDKQIVRLAALLHDTGHSPFSRAGEDLFPIEPTSEKHYKHEAYSAAVIRYELCEVIDSHPSNKRTWNISADEVASLIAAAAGIGERLLFWRDLIDGQMDADRMDYLLRDSLHTGVDYGRYDWRRILNTVAAIWTLGDGSEPPVLRVGVTEGGIHAAEALVQARYYMFSQVYFHKTRVAYNHHIRYALQALLPDGRFPPPTAEGIRAYLKWDDWRVLGMLADGGGGDHGERLATRNHYRQVFHTTEHPSPPEVALLSLVRERLGALLAAEELSQTSSYKLDRPDINVISDDDSRQVRTLSHYSSIVRELNRNSIEVTRVYAKPEDAKRARAFVTELKQGAA